MARRTTIIRFRFLKSLTLMGIFVVMQPHSSAAQDPSSNRQPTKVSSFRISTDCAYKGQIAEIQACAEVRGAAATEFAARWAAISALFAAAGILALLIQLMATRRAIKDGATAIASAQEANQIALKALHNDRAWLCPVGVRQHAADNAITPQGECVPNSLAFTAEWKNVGRTPATRAVLYNDIRVFPFETTVADATWDTPMPSYDEFSSVVGPDQIVSSQFLTVTGEEIQAFRSRDVFIVIASKAIYRDLFEPDVIRQTGVRFIIKHQGGHVTLPDGQKHEMVVTSCAPYGILT